MSSRALMQGAAARAHPNTDKVKSHGHYGSSAGGPPEKRPPRHLLGARGCQQLQGEKKNRAKGHLREPWKGGPGKPGQPMLNAAGGAPPTAFRGAAFYPTRSSKGPQKRLLVGLPARGNLVPRFSQKLANPGPGKALNEKQASVQIPRVGRKLGKVGPVEHGLALHLEKAARQAAAATIVGRFGLEYPLIENGVDPPADLDVEGV
eukprot:UN2339